MLVITSLHKTLKRELRLNDRVFILTLSPESLKLTAKGHRKGYTLKWDELVSGDAALATALNASIGKFAAGAPKASRSAAPSNTTRRKR